MIHLLDAFHWSQLLQPQFYIEHGGLWVLLFVIFAETGLFAGFLLYIGASDILPEAHSKHSSFKLIGLTVLGTLVIFVITRLA